MPQGNTETPADVARRIFAASRYHGASDGERAVMALTKGREKAELSDDELRLLALGYNWWGKHEDAYRASLLLLTRHPQDEAVLEGVRLHLWNARHASGYLAEGDRLNEAGLGPPAYWRLIKADFLLSRAKGEHELEDYEWVDGDPILHPEDLDAAAAELEMALKADPSLRDGSKKWAGDWNDRFRPILDSPAYRHLARP